MEGVGRLNHKRNKEKQKAQKKVDGCWGRKAKRHKRKIKGTKQNGGCLEYGMP